MTWVAIILYSLTVIGLGWWASRNTADGLGFWTADRSLGAGSVGLSISAGFMSVSWSCVYAVQLFYWYGLAGIWLITVPWLIALTGIYFLAKKYHGLPSFSQPEMVGNRFGIGVKRTVAIALAFVFLVWGGAEIYVAARLLAPGLDISIAATILGISAVVGMYATLGGFKAVVATDKLQYVIVALYITAMAWFAANGLWEKGYTWFPDKDILTLKTGRSWTDLLGPGMLTIILGFMAYLPGWLFETDLWVRVQAAKSARAARKGMLIAGTNALIFVGILPLFIGIAALAIYTPVAGVAPLVTGIEGDTIFIALVRDYAPAWLAMLVAIGLVAAAMSTIDTCLNVMALSIGYDLLQLHHKKNGKVLSQLVTVGAMAAAAVFALNTESLWDIFYLSGGILTTTVAFPVAAVFYKDINSKGVFFSVVFGFTTTILAYFLQSAGILAEIQPDWINASDLGYILWGILLAGIGYLFGLIRSKWDSAA